MQNRNMFFNGTVLVILAISLITTLAFVVSMDRMRLNLEEVRNHLRDVGERMETLETTPRPVSLTQAQIAGVNATGGISSTRGPEDFTCPNCNSHTTTSAKAANAEFFDPNAVSGDRMVQAIAADTGNMNYLINNDSTVSEFWGRTTESLASRNWSDLGKFEPLLAESWTISPDNKTFTVRLREGILWHDFKDPVSGKEWKDVEVKADDFKFYVDVIKNEGVEAAPLRSYFSGIDRIEVVNDHEFKVIWNTPYFMAKEITLGLMPLPRHLYHAYDGPFDPKKFNEDHERNRMIVGCGPYEFVSWDKGKRVVFKRFRNYYGRRLGIQPPVTTLVYDLIQHPKTRLQALLSKDLDMDTLTSELWVNNTDTPEFGPDGFLRKIKYPASAYNYIGLNLKKEVFADRNVRVALSHLVDRDRIIRDVLYGLARPISGPLFLDSPAYDASVKPYPFSVETAKKMLAESGWKDSDGDGILDKNGQKFEFTILYPNSNPNYKKILAILQEDMAKAGIRLEILALEWSVLIQRINKRAFDAAILGWTTPIMQDPYQLWHSSGADEEASSNYIGFSNPEADKLIDGIRGSFDDAERIRLYHKFHRLIHDEAPYLFLFSPYSLLVTNKRYRNQHVFPTGVPDSTFWTPRTEQLAVPGL